MTANGQSIDYPDSPTAHPIGPPGDWDAMVSHCALWVISLLALALGAGGYLLASRNDKVADAAMNARQATELASLKKDIDNRMESMTRDLAAQKPQLPSDGLGSRIDEVEASVASMGSKLDNSIAVQVSSSGRLDARLNIVENNFDGMALRLFKDEEEAASVKTTVESLSTLRKRPIASWRPFHAHRNRLAAKNKLARASQ